MGDLNTFAIPPCFVTAENKGGLLHKLGLIHSRRGPQGGHTLAKSPQEINLRMVTDGLEGKNAPLECIEEPAECTLYDICAQRGVWTLVEEAIQEVLNATTIGDLVRRQNHLQITARNR